MAYIVEIAPFGIFHHDVQILVIAKAILEFYDVWMVQGL